MAGSLPWLLTAFFSCSLLGALALWDGGLPPSSPVEAVPALVARVEGGLLAQVGEVAPPVDDGYTVGVERADEPGSPVGVSEVPAVGRGAEAQRLVYDPLTGFPSFPLPEAEPPPPGTPGGFGPGFAAPLPRSPVWNPPGPKRVGVQAGHWLTEQVPSELRRLGPGTSGGGWQEWEVNLLLARRTAALLEAAGVQVDLLPTTIPARYRAHLFVSIHADGDTTGRLNGYKIARPGFSSIPEADDELVRVLYREYGAATGMARDSDAHISRRMTFYYAFNTRRYQHAIDLGTPAAIIETGFLTNASDRAFLTGQPDRVARGIANGILRFLELEYGREEWGRLPALLPNVP